MGDEEEHFWFDYEANDFWAEPSEHNTFSDNGELSGGWQGKDDCDYCFRSQIYDEVCIACGHLFACTHSSCCHNYEKEDEATVRHPDDCEVCFGCGCEFIGDLLLCPSCGHSQSCSYPDKACQEPRHCPCQEGISRQFCESCKHDRPCELAIDECPDVVHCNCVSDNSKICLECKHDELCLEAGWFCEESTHDDDGTYFVKAWS